MGLSSSQARLLNLTNRMHQIEYNASRIEAMKLQMANESRRVYEDYLEALDQAKIQKKTLTTNGAVTFVDMKSYQNFLDAGFALVVNSPKIDNNQEYTTQGVNPAYTEWLNSHNANEPKRSDYPDGDEGTASFNAAHNDWEAEEFEGDQLVDVTTTTNSHSIICETEAQLIDIIKMVFTGEDGAPLDITQGLQNNFEETLTNLINCGYVTIIQKPSDPAKYNGQLDDQGYPIIGTNAFSDLETSVAINTSLQEVTDDVKLRKAEAKYEADMKRIDMKDRRYDSDLAALDNERNAIKQEMETLKTVARDNVDRTFKIFS